MKNAGEVVEESSDVDDEDDHWDPIAHDMELIESNRVSVLTAEHIHNREGNGVAFKLDEELVWRGTRISDSNCSVEGYVLPDYHLPLNHSSFEEVDWHKNDPDSVSYLRTGMSVKSSEYNFSTMGVFSAKLSEEEVLQKAMALHIEGIEASREKISERISSLNKLCKVYC